MKKILITGISGQDGSYLAEFLLEKGYAVHGIVRRTAVEDNKKRLSRIDHILDKIHIHGATLEDYPSIYKVVNEVKPDECYHLGAQSFVKYSFEDEFSTMNTNVNGTHYILSAIKDIVPECKVLFAASSEMFGNAEESPQNKNTPFNPRSVYGISKVAGFNLIKYYREAYNLFACSSICFNHCSERRGSEFVTRKITRAVAEIKLGKRKELRLGNIEAKRDWGYAGSFVKAMYLMLQQDKPDDFVIATGEMHSIKEFLDTAFNYVGLNWKDYVKIDKKFYRPSDVFELKGDCNKAKEILGWQSETSFLHLVKLMVNNDLMELKNKN